MNTIVEDLAAGRILVSDGAWGTVLSEKGLQAGECPELWNADHPEVVRDIARGYIEAGTNHQALAQATRDNPDRDQRGIPLLDTGHLVSQIDYKVGAD